MARRLMQTALVGAALAMFAATASVRADHIFEGQSFYGGGWWLSGNRQGDIILGDGQGWGLRLTSTDRYCGRPGASYAVMRDYVQSTQGAGLDWFVDEICTDGYVRVCVYARWGDMACSTYGDQGWVPLD